MSRDDHFRALTSFERNLLERLLAVDFPGARELRRQLFVAQVRATDDDGCLEFLVNGGPPAPVVQRVPVEAQVNGRDGVAVHCLLFVTNGVLSKLEFYK